jgi:hypothetical protein
MSALAGNRWEVRREAAGSAAPLSKDSSSPLQNRISALRDTLLVLGLQVVFRITLILRRWNY